MFRRSSRSVILTASLLLALFVGAACSGDDGGDGAGGGGTSTEENPGGTTRARAVALDAQLGVITGRINVQRRRAVLARVSTVVDRWFEAAYLAGEYPRTDFSRAFPGFTPGAVRLARKDAAILSNKAIGRRVDEVVAQRKSVRVDVLSPRGFARAATARVELVFTTEGDLRRRYVVHGRLMLTRHPSGLWKVFGYDVRRTDRPVGGAGR